MYERAEGEARCPYLFPGTDIQCAGHRHPPESACWATGVREGRRFTLLWWSVDPPASTPPG